MDLASYLTERKQLVESHLVQSLADHAIPKTLERAMRYSLDAGGKRIRPILAIAGAEAVGGTAEKVMPLAVALEMIHTFSLIHDDLPAMDDDDLRRGRATNHKVFGEATAILAGDALFAEAFSVLTSAAPHVSSQILVEVIRNVAHSAGARGMTGGQVIDMEATGKKATEAELERIHRHKTGELLTIPAVAGAMLSGATPVQLDCLRAYGESLGLAFQIADDILDIEGSEAEIGKDVGSDEQSGKATYPVVLGMERARKKAAELADQAVSALYHFDDRAEPLRAIARYVVERRR